MSCCFICPKCASPLSESEKTWFCPNRHSYDRAKAGYTNLLPPSGHHNHGDDKAMVRSRRAFLESGAYDCLSDAVNEVALSLFPSSPFVLDAGCGEGYYTHRLYRALIHNGFAPRMAAVDLSKEALIAAAKRTRDISWAAASVYALPVADASADLVLNIFSPLAREEYFRVLKPGGLFLYAVPLPEHLFALKAAIYDRPYENPALSTDFDGFALCERREIRSDFFLPDNESVRNLFTMTPYCHKTSPADLEKLNALSSLTVTAAFALLVYRRIGA